MERSGALDITPLTDADIGEVIALWTQCGLTRPWNDPYADIALARETPSSDVLIGRHEGRIVATAMVGSDGHRGYAYYEAVDPDLQRTGLGREIMEAAETWLKARGCPKFHVLVRSANTEAMAFYERLGFATDDALLLGKRFDA